MKAVVVLTTTPDLKTARSIAKTLVQKKLAGCVSLLENLESVYRWKGKPETAREVLVLIKTPQKNFSRVKNFIKANHPYEVPEIIAIPIAQASRKYLNWLSGL